MTVKKLLSIALLVLLALSLAGCRGAEEAVKLCRIEITDLTGEREPVTLAELSQKEVNEFLGTEDWENEETDAPADLTPQYRIEVYQDPTKTAMQLEDTQPLKILEYVTYADTNVVKCTVGGEILPEEIVEGFLEHYNVAPPSFFASLNAALS